MNFAARIVMVLSTIFFSCNLACHADQASSSPESDKSTTPEKKVRGLMVTGGCCHDYENQKRIISEGLQKQVGNIQWTILDYADTRETKAKIYEQEGWIKDFDIVLHNECFGGVTDGDFVKSIVDAHAENHIPAVCVHCSMHSYRNAPTADHWREFLGVTSRRHEKKKRPLEIIPTEAGLKSPITEALGKSWTTPNGELYIIEKAWPEMTPLAYSHSTETNKDEPVIWTNQYRNVRVFATTLGHHNVTMETPQWQSMLAEGWKWALGKDAANPNKSKQILQLETEAAN